jgi:putative protease
VILSVENDRNNLAKLAAASQRFTPLATVFGWPSLFTSRLEIKPRPGSIIRDSKRIGLQHSRQAELTSVHSDRPLCLFEHLVDLGKLGVRDFVVDLRGQKRSRQEFYSLLKALKRQQCPRPHSTFNYLRKLL